LYQSKVLRYPSGWHLFIDFCRSSRYPTC